MASQFESLLDPFVILFSIPLAIVGAVLALKLTGNSLSVVVFIGLILLAGIVEQCDRADRSGQPVTRGRATQGRGDRGSVFGAPAADHHEIGQESCRGRE